MFVSSQALVNIFVGMDVSICIFSLLSNGRCCFSCRGTKGRYCRCRFGVLVHTRRVAPKSIGIKGFANIIYMYNVVPTGMFLTLTMHDTTEIQEFGCTSMDLPWWASIAATTVAIRLCIFPVVIATMRNNVRLSNIKPEMDVYIEKMKKFQAKGDMVSSAKEMEKLRVCHKR